MTIRRLSNSVSRRAENLGRFVRQQLRPAPPKTLPVFILGCQRSGTTMLSRVFERSPDAWVYGEASHSPAFRTMRMRDRAQIARLIRRHNAHAVIFKPLTDTQWGDRLLDEHPGSRAVWAFRDYRDVAASAVDKWGAHQREVIEKLAERDDAGLGWRSERVSEELRDELATLIGDGIDDYSGAVLFWYLRNRYLFDLDLASRAGVLVVAYEDLVGDPLPAFSRLFDYLELPFDASFVHDVSARSVGRAEGRALPPTIERTCDAMLERLRRAGRVSPTAAHPHPEPTPE